MSMSLNTGFLALFTEPVLRQSLPFGGDAQVHLAQPAYGDLIEGGVFSRGGPLSGNITSHLFEPLGHPFDRRSIIGGALTCPKTVNNSGSASCDQQLADDDPADADPDDTTNELFRRSDVPDGLLEHYSCERPFEIRLRSLMQGLSSGEACQSYRLFRVSLDYQLIVRTVQNLFYLQACTLSTMCVHLCPSLRS